MLKHYPHNPPHLFLDDQYYFITAACYQKKHLMNSDENKQYLLDTLKDYANRVKWELDNWVILSNHYHFSIKSKLGKDLSYLMGNVHRKTAKFVRDHDAFEGKNVWWNYWDYCPRNERDYYQHLNYMLYNPVKHGYGADLKDFKWSSFHALLDDFGSERLAKQFRQLGFKDLRIDFELNDDF